MSNFSFEGKEQRSENMGQSSEELVKIVTLLFVSIIDMEGKLSGYIIPGRISTYLYGNENLTPNFELTHERNQQL